MRNKRRGFSYVEVCMAAAVLFIVLIPLFPALSVIRKNAEYARERYQAQLLAAELVSAAQDGAFDPSDWPPETVGFGYGVWTADVPYMSPDAPEYEMAITCENIAGPALNAADLTVSAVWNRRGVPLGRALGFLGR